MPQINKPLKATDGDFFCDQEQDKRFIKHLKDFGGHSLNDKELLLRYINSNSIVIDIGAHIGTFTIPLAKHAKHIYAFEPTENTAETLRKNIKINNIKNVTVIQSVVGAKTGFAQKNSPNLSDRGNNYYTESKTESGIKITTLADVVTKVDIIKIDAEGMELKILKGAEELIKNNKPVIYFELSRKQLERYGDNVFKLYLFFKRLGYRTYYNTGHSHDTSSPINLKRAWLPFFAFAKRNHDILAIPHNYVSNTIK